MKKVWETLPANLRTAIVAAALLILGAATETAVAWLEAVKNQAGA